MERPEVCLTAEDADRLARVAPGLLESLMVTVAPAGTDGWGDLRRAAAPIEVRRRDRLLVASLDDLIRTRVARRGPGDLTAVRDLQLLQTAIERVERAEAANRPRFPAHWDAGRLAHLDWLLERGRVRRLPPERRYAAGVRLRTLTGFCS